MGTMSSWQLVLGVCMTFKSSIALFDAIIDVTLDNFNVTANRHWCFLHLPLMELVLAVSSSQCLALWNDHISKNLDQAKPSPFLSKVFLRSGK